MRPKQGYAPLLRREPSLHPFQLGLHLAYKVNSDPTRLVRRDTAEAFSISAPLPLDSGAMRMKIRSGGSICQQLPLPKIFTYVRNSSMWVPVHGVLLSLLEF